MLKVRLHELEAYGEELQARPTSLAGLLASAAAATSARGAYSVVSAVGAPLPDYLAEVDKLRERQDAYLRAASDFTSISSAAGTVAVH